jgi:phenylacetate-coenzyme A ligase PaaK-like adenylate-forming protein
MLNFIMPEELSKQMHGFSNQVDNCLKALRPDLSASEFAVSALELLNWQAKENPVYKRFLTGLGLDPLKLTRWEDFPALPVSAFRDQAICCFPSAEAKVIFETSGTTASKTGRHYFADLRCYEQSLLAGFKMFMPNLQRHRWLSLVPPVVLKQNSSLGYMIDYLGKTIPQKNCQSFCDANYQIDFDRLAHELNAANNEGIPVALFGTSFALATIGEVFQEQQQSWRLAPDSVIFDTGGYKGRRRELTTNELMALMVNVFGFNIDHIYNEYGMTELSTPAYARLNEGIHRFPPWLKVLIRNPLTAKICQPGEKGLVQLYDLANVNSIMAIGTMDSAVYEQDGICLLGRVAAADLRGCSLPYEV